MEDHAAEISARLALARQIAEEAGHTTRAFFRTNDLQVERKADQSPVTAADRQAEQLLRDRIAAQFPQDGVVGEEFGETAGTSPFRWILDPIDGTKSFIHGVPLYTTLVGIETDGRGVAGVLYAPATDELLFASRGQGAWYRDGQQELRQVHVSGTKRLAESLFVTTSVKSFATDRETDALDRWLELQQAARLTRTWGDAYGYLLVATGQAEVMVDPALSIWDAAAIQPILEEAGGTFTDWQGRATIHHGEGVGTNGHVLDEVLEILAGGRASDS